MRSSRLPPSLTSPVTSRWRFAAVRATSLTVRHLQAVVRELMLMIRSHGLPLTVLTAAGRDATWMEMLVLAKAREAAAARPARV